MKRKHTLFIVLSLFVIIFDTPLNAQRQTSNYLTLSAGVYASQLKIRDYSKSSLPGSAILPEALLQATFTKTSGIHQIGLSGYNGALAINGSKDNSVQARLLYIEYRYLNRFRLLHEKISFQAGFSIDYTAAKREYETFINNSQESESFISMGPAIDFSIPISQNNRFYFSETLSSSLLFYHFRSKLDDPALAQASGDLQNKFSSLADNFSIRNRVSLKMVVHKSAISMDYVLSNMERKSINSIRRFTQSIGITYSIRL